MNKKELTQETPVETKTEVQSDAPQAQPQTNQQQTFSFTSEQFKEILQQTISSVIEASSLQKPREQIADYNKKISEAAQNSQASIIQPQLKTGEVNLDYVNKVLEQDSIERKRNSDGKTYYGETGEDFMKAKIVILREMGLTKEEIVKYFFDN